MINYSALSEKTEYKIGAGKLLLQITIWVVGIVILAGTLLELNQITALNIIMLPVLSISFTYVIVHGLKMTRKSMKIGDGIQEFAESNGWDIELTPDLTDRTRLAPSSRKMLIIQPLMYIIQGGEEATRFTIIPILESSGPFNKFFTKYETHLVFEGSYPPVRPLAKDISVEYENDRTYVVLHHTAHYTGDFKQLFGSVVIG